jgi:hypothetical protein
LTSTFVQNVLIPKTDPSKGGSYSCLSPEMSVKISQGGVSERYVEKRLVVSACKEDLSFLLRDLSLFDHVIVYSKCNFTEFPAFLLNASHVDIVELPNIGSGEHTFMHHMIRSHDVLAERTVFWAGSVQYPGCLPHTLLGTTKDKCIADGGVCCCLTDLKGRWGFYPNFTVSNYVKRGPFTLADVRPIGAWARCLLGEDSARVFEAKACYSGFYSVSRARILAQDLRVLKGLYMQQFTMSGEAEHYQERLEGALFSSDPFRPPAMQLSGCNFSWTDPKLCPLI